VILLGPSDPTLFQGSIQRCGPFEYTGIVREAESVAVLAALILRTRKMSRQVETLMVLFAGLVEKFNAFIPVIRSGLVL
jgi:hypothetical protein